MGASTAAIAPASTNRFVGILATVGGVLFVVGVSLVIKSNWELLSDWTKIVGELALLIGAYWLGWRLKIAPGRYPKIGDAFLMIGAVLFLLGITLVSQIYHLNSRPANGVLLWWAGIAAFPWLTRAKGAQFVSVAAGLVWLGMEFNAPDSWLRLLADRGSRWYDGDYFLFAAAGFLVGTGLTLLGRGMHGGSYVAFAGLHEKLGLGLMCWALYSLGFTWSVHSYHSHEMAAARWQPVALLVLALIATAAWAFRRNPSGTHRLAWLAVVGFVPVVAHLSGFDPGWSVGAVAWVALFLLNIGMIRVGVVEGLEGWINLGIAGIALNIITRYFLLFGTMLQGGSFFIVSGLLVLGLGYWLERKRRSLLGSLRKEVAS